MSKKPSPRAGRNPESGYVLLLVFAMAAIVAVTLYMQIPRAAFEAQRDKEERLMDNGHEYVRAITLFVRKFNRFPSTMDELEHTNNIRFLRRRFIDPMTGKDDWRILHAGPGGVITDSIIKKKADAAAPEQTFITELHMFGSEPVAGTDGVNLATRKRASDQTGGVGGVAGGGGLDNNAPGNNTMSAGPSSGNSTAVYNGPVMVLPNGQIVPASTGDTGTGVPPVAGAPGAPGATGGQLPGGMAPQQQTQGGQNIPGLPPQLGPPAGAAGLINQILTTPRPGGLNGLQGGIATTTQGFGTPLSAAPVTTGTPAPAQAGQQVIGAGIAGVASKRQQEGIKVYNDRSKYNEWEFVYDVTKDPSKVGSAAAAANAAATTGANGATGSQGPGGAFGQSSPGSAFGAPSTTGTSSVPVAATPSP